MFPGCVGSCQGLLPDRSCPVTNSRGEWSESLCLPPCTRPIGCRGGLFRLESAPPQPHLQPVAVGGMGGGAFRFSIFVFVAAEIDCLSSPPQKPIRVCLVLAKGSGPSRRSSWPSSSSAAPPRAPGASRARKPTPIGSKSLFRTCFFNHFITFENQMNFLLICYFFTIF